MATGIIISGLNSLFEAIVFEREIPVIRAAFYCLVGALMNAVVVAIFTVAADAKYGAQNAMEFIWWLFPIVVLTFSSMRLFALVLQGALAKYRFDDATNDVNFKS
jgi:hypothetical protein